MKKKIVLAMMVGLVATSLMGCTVEKTVTTTETHTDADGNTTTTTTTKTTDENGTTTTTETTEGAAEDDVIVAKLTFANESGVDFNEMYFALNSSDSWGDEILGDQAPLASGEMISSENFTYSEADSVWDIKIVDPDGNEVDFTGADMLLAADPEEITLLFEYDDAEGAITVEIQ